MAVSCLSLQRVSSGFHHGVSEHMTAPWLGMADSHFLGDELDTAVHCALGLDPILLKKDRAHELVYPLAVLQFIELLKVSVRLPSHVSSRKSHTSCTLMFSCF